MIAASYEAKKYGVRTGTPLWEAERMLGKKLVKRIPDHSWYRQVSERLMKYLTAKLGKIEVFSIDELFAELVEPLAELGGVAPDGELGELQRARRV